jgi:hypothetical protein
MGPLLIRTSLAGYIATSFIISFGPSHRLAGLKREVRCEHHAWTVAALIPNNSFVIGNRVAGLTRFDRWSSLKTLDAARLMVAVLQPNLRPHSQTCSVSQCRILGDHRRHDSLTQLTQSIFV